MNQINPKVLIVATSRKTRGGITSVIKAHESGEQWKKYSCKWIETHRDGNRAVKIFYGLFGFVQFILCMPFFHIFHFHVSFQGSLTRKYYLNKLALLFGKKTIVHFHPPTPDVLFDKRNAERYKNLFGSASKVLVLSNEWKKLLNSQLGVFENVEVLFNPCPQVEGIFKDSEKNNNRYILFAGTLIERKGYKSLIEAFACIAKLFPEWKLILAGNGEIDIAKDLIKKNYLESQVILKGWQTKEEMKVLYKNASIFCLASSGEGFPMVVLEAWAYGVPVVTTLVGGLPDVVIDGVNALTFNYGDSKKLSTQLNRLMSNPELREIISSESLILSKEYFSIDKINKQLGEIYNNIIYNIK